MDTAEISLAKLPSGCYAQILRFEGGEEASRRLKAIGLRIDKKIKKISAGFFLGPIFLSVDGVKLAIGHGLASKVMVKPLEGEKK